MPTNLPGSVTILWPKRKEKSRNSKTKQEIEEKEGWVPGDIRNREEKKETKWKKPKKKKRRK